MTDTDKTDSAGPKNKDEHYVTRLHEVKTMTDHALEAHKKKMVFLMTKMVERTKIDALEICAVDGQDGADRSVASLVKRSIVGDALDDGVFAVRIQWVFERGFIHPVMIQAATDALPKKEQLMGFTATFVSSSAEKQSASVKHCKDRYVPEPKIRELPLSSPTPDSLNDDKVPSRNYKKDVLSMAKEETGIQICRRTQVELT